MYVCTYIVLLSFSLRFAYRILRLLDSRKIWKCTHGKIAVYKHSLCREIFTYDFFQNSFHDKFSEFVRESTQISRLVCADLIVGVYLLTRVTGCEHVRNPVVSETVDNQRVYPRMQTNLI